jgi:nucleoside-specific outer membrane channel protein Tsx
MRKSFLSLLLGLSLFAATAARADSMTYNFTYTGTGTYDTHETANGMGSFTYTFTPGGSTGTLSAFSFSDTLVSPTYGTSDFSYSGLGDVAGSAITLQSNGTIATITINTDYLTGSNAGFGPVRFVLQDSAVTNDSTSGSNAAAGDFLGDFTSGTNTLAAGSPAAAPEPSSLLLLGTGILGAAGVLRRKFRA